MYQAILSHISELASSCGRDPAEITLVAVTKGRPLDAVMQLYEQGCRDFGENRLQELLAKKREAPPDIHWHMIGTLQKNKAVRAAANCLMIHSVDSIDLALKLKGTPILLQVNTSGELTKHGFTPEAFEKALPQLKDCDIRGLMTMAPLTDDKAAIRATFRTLRILRDSHLPGGHLSMGMSNDYPIAIEEGATYLRLGSILFDKNQ